MCLDVLRAAAKTPQALQLLFAELGAARGGDARLDQFVSKLHADLSDTSDFEIRARRLTEHLALALQGALLVRFAPHTVSDAFCTSRLGDEWGGAFGTLPSNSDFDAIIDRAMPAQS
jgi:putative acyl-CoA dehydrogenase